MRALAFQAATALLLTAACGGGTSARPDGGPGPCDNLGCLQLVEALLEGCPAGGTCTTESTTAPAGSRICWANGVRLRGTSETSSGTITATVVVQQFDQVCYTRTFVSVTSPSGTTTLSNSVQDSTGAMVATIDFDSDGVPSVTCPGRPTTVVDPACGISMLALNGSIAYVDDPISPGCQDGPCAF